MVPGNYITIQLHGLYAQQRRTCDQLPVISSCNSTYVAMSAQTSSKKTLLMVTLEKL